MSHEGVRMAIRADESFPERGLLLLRECYRYVDQGWQHSVRLELPDQGFEVRFRETCIERQIEWSVSQHRELQLGCGLDTASGVNHEVDLVVKYNNILGILELKNRQAFPPDKNDVIVFFAKMLDYFALTPRLLKQDVIPVFMSCFPFERSGLSACLGLGIHPIAPLLRPLPMLMDNAKRIQVELNNGAPLSVNDIEQFEDFCAGVNRLGIAIGPAAMNRRVDYFNDDTITVSAVTPQHTGTLSDDLIRLNATCTRLIGSVSAAVAKRSEA